MKKNISRICRLFAFLAGVILIYYLLDYGLSDDTKSMSRITMHDFYAQSDIDIAFIGTSHVKGIIDTEGMGETLGKTIFNLSNSGQDLRGSYYLLKDLLKYYSPEMVFIELSYSRLVKTKGDPTYIYCVSDYMSFPNSVKYLLDSFTSKDYINSFFRLRRNIDPLELPDVSEIMETVNAKADKTYINYQDKEYLGLGLWEFTGKIGNANSTAVNIKSEDMDRFGVNKIKSINWEYLKSMMDMCCERGVTPIFFITPVSEYYTMGFENYSDFERVTKKKMKEMGATLIDLNLIKTQYCCFDDSDFMDLEHMNTAAGRELSAFLTEYIKNPDGDYFYSKLEERYPHDDKIKYAGYERYFVLSDGTKTNSLKKAKNDGKLSKYYVVVSPVAYIDIPVDIRLTEVVLNDSGKWIEKNEIKGKRLDEFSARFKLTYDGFETYYKIQFFKPDTEELLYEVVQKFKKS